MTPRLYFFIALVAASPLMAAASRPFEAVVDEVLAAASIDARRGLKGAKRVALRRVTFGRSLPKAHKEYLEASLAEALQAATGATLIDCRPCRSPTAMLVEGKLLIAPAASNVSGIDTAVQDLGIEHFVDAVFLMQKSSIALAIQVFDAKSKALTWSRTYNSETLLRRQARLASLQSDITKSRGEEAYVPEFNVAFGLGGAALPNVAGSVADSTMLLVQARLSETFAERRHEFGLLLSFFKTTRSAASKYPAQEPDPSVATKPKEKIIKPIPKPFEQAVAIHGAFGTTLLGSPNNHDRARLSAQAGLGLFAAPGYLTPSARFGLEALLGTRFLASAAALYVAPSSVQIADQARSTPGGAGGEIAFLWRY